MGLRALLEVGGRLDSCLCGIGPYQCRTYMFVRSRLDGMLLDSTLSMPDSSAENPDTSQLKSVGSKTKMPFSVAR